MSRTMQKKVYLLQVKTSGLNLLQIGFDLIRNKNHLPKILSLCQTFPSADKHFELSYFHVQRKV